MLELSPTLSFCELDGRFVFLDLAKDRYFCLDGALATSWRAALSDCADADQIASLRTNGFIALRDGRPLRECPDGVARRSALDGQGTTFGRLAAVGHAWRVARMRRRLASGGLGDAVAMYAEAKTRALPRQYAEALLAPIARSFTGLDLLATRLDRCLPRSLALATFLAKSGFAPEIVFAVRLGPFAAHCWVECGGLLMNDRYERVRQFRPILRL